MRIHKYKTRVFEKNTNRVFFSAKSRGFRLNWHYPSVHREFTSFYEYDKKKYWNWAYVSFGPPIRRAYEAV